MNLKKLKRATSEVTETDTARSGEMNDLNVARDESDKTHSSDQLNSIEENVVDGVFDKQNIKDKVSNKTAMSDQLGRKEEECVNDVFGERSIKDEEVCTNGMPDQLKIKEEDAVIDMLDKLNSVNEESDMNDNGDQLSIKEEKAVIGALRTLSFKDEDSDITDNGHQLNIKDEKAVIESFGKLTIEDKADIIKTHRPRGPTGGNPVSYCVSPGGNQYVAAEAANSAEYHHQQQPNYAALNGRRMLEEAEQPPRKFVAAPDFDPQRARQLAQKNVKIQNQGQMPVMYNANLTYQPGQIFGLPQQGNTNFTTKNITADETATVNLFQEIGPQNLADKLLDDWEVFPSIQNNGTKDMTPNMTQASGSVTNVNKPESLEHPTPQQYMSSSSQLPGSFAVPVTSNTALDHEVSQQITCQSLTRHRSDLSDSGVSSAGQASPYSGSVSSPDESTQTGRLSVDSGFGTNSKSVLASPENISQDSVSRTLPNIYSGMHQGITGRYDCESQLMPQKQKMQTPINATSSPSGFQCQETNTDLHSDYIDEHLYGFQDALAVIANDKIDDNEGNPFEENGSSPQDEQNQKPVCMENGNFQPVTSPTYNNGKLSMVAEFTPAKTRKRTVTPVSSNITTNILPPNQPFVVPPQQPVMIHNKATISTVQTMASVTTTKPMPTQNPFFAPSPQPAETKRVAVFILSPNMAGKSETAPDFLVPSIKTQNKEPARRRFREIRPKPVPINAETQTEINTDQTSGNMGKQIDTITAQNAGNKMVLGPDQPAVKNTQTQSQLNHHGTKQRQRRPLDSARRSLKEVKTETLKQTYEEGNTHLHMAICNEDRFGIKALLERLKREKLMYMVDQENNDRQTPVFLAVAKNDPAKVQLLINAGANLNTLAQNLSSDNHTREVKAAIHVASVGGKESLKTLEELLKGDVNINLVNNYGQTALHVAVLAHGVKHPSSNMSIDSRTIIQALIKKGADPCVQDKITGRTPLMYAIVCKHISLVDTILTVVDPSNIRNLVTTQAFDGSSCLKIAEETKTHFNTSDFNRLWDILQRATNSHSLRIQT